MKRLVIFAFLGIFSAAVYFLDPGALAANDMLKNDKAAKADDKQPDAVPTEAEFMKVMDKCVRCHKKPCASVDALKQAKWIVPGKPESSSVYKVIGKCKKVGGTYHNLSDEEKKTVNDFIKNLK